jgi:hypothetical protein
VLWSRDVSGMEGKGGCLGEARRTHVYRRKEQLIACDARHNGAVCGFEIDVFGQEAVPLCGCGAEDDCIVSELVFGQGLSYTSPSREAKTV